MRTLKYDLDSIQVKQLIKCDSKLKSLCESVQTVTVTLHDDYFESLIFTILSQQLSSKVAQIMINRFVNLLNHQLDPQKILTFSDEEYRQIGLSYQKIKYIRSLSDAVIQKVVDFQLMEQMDDQQIIEMLIKVKGIGPWSADMFLMFSLGREDVFSALDLGLRNAVKNLYNNQNLTNLEIQLISEKWKPYRSIASHFLWHSHDQNG